MFLYILPLINLFLNAQNIVIPYCDYIMVKEIRKTCSHTTLELACINFRLFKVIFIENYIFQYCFCILIYHELFLSS
jgi:hypothetical protein